MPKHNTNKKHKRQRLTRVRVRAERRRQPDWDRFAWALLLHTKRLMEREEKQR
jgi:hypothetical protein